MSHSSLMTALFSLKKNDGSAVESLDYEVIENFAYREEQAHRRRKLYVSYLLVVKWFFALLIGIFYSSVCIITFSPAAAGSGIPEIKGYLNGVDTHGILLFRTLIGKVFGSIGSVGGGLALGKEGPLVHTGACIASLLGQGGSTKYHLNSRWFNVFKSDRDRRDLVTCGCAAGVAAAFRAPVGGVLFALEEVTSWWRSQLMRVHNMGCIRWSRGLFVCRVIPNGYYWGIGGLLGALFNQLTLYITTWRRNHLHKKGNRVKIIEACLVSLLTSVISFGLPLLRKCSPCPEPDPTSGIECPRPPGMYGNYVNFYCSKDNEYNDLATIFFNTQMMP
ncbi:hypothetical protein KIW84_UN0879 [Lathyrus oleraceus]|nr:hypothetical protein KIW84_UN0879 [Pisum sativum]